MRSLERSEVAGRTEVLAVHLEAGAAPRADLEGMAIRAATAALGETDPRTSVHSQDNLSL
jgi:hypothetical protein